MYICRHSLYDVPTCSKTCTIAGMERKNAPEETPARLLNQATLVSAPLTTTPSTRPKQAANEKNPPPRITYDAGADF
jgi:hypothetical protein